MSQVISAGLSPGMPAEIGIANPRLYNLADFAPEIEHGSLSTLFPFSNDALAGQYQEVADRWAVNPPKNRSGVLLAVGEASLMVALAHDHFRQPVVLADVREEHVRYMRYYVGALRECETNDSWMSVMRSAIPDGDVAHFDTAWKAHVAEWESAGFGHPLVESKLYAVARERAQRRLIVPWLGSLSSRYNMENLGAAIRSSRARVSGLVLSNVLPINDDPDNPGPQPVLRAIQKLPWVQDAPILTTQPKGRGGAENPSDDRRAPNPIVYGIDRLGASEAYTGAVAHYKGKRKPGFGGFVSRLARAV